MKLLNPLIINFNSKVRQLKSILTIFIHHPTHFSAVFIGLQTYQLSFPYACRSLSADISRRYSIILSVKQPAFHVAPLP